MRDFLKEVGIIVIGVLIALGAEQGAEALHWRHKVAQAESAMRLELSEDDGEEAFVRLAVAGCLDDALVRMNAAAAGGASATELGRLANAYHPPLRIFDSEAWKAVVASDVGTHMDAAQMVAWSAPYRLMPVATDLDQREGAYVTDLQTAVATTGARSPAELQDFRRSVGQLRRSNSELAGIARVILVRMRGLGVSVPADAQRSLLADARNRYGECAVAPDLTRASSLTELSAERELREYGLGRPSMDAAPAARVP